MEILLLFAIDYIFQISKGLIRQDSAPRMRYVYVPSRRAQRRLSWYR